MFELVLTLHYKGSIPAIIIIVIIIIVIIIIIIIIK